MHGPRNVPSWAISFAFVLVCGSIQGDVPKLDFLYPAGMQRGATTTVTCHGEFEWPVQVWAPGAVVQVEEEKGKLRIFVAHNYAADRIWIRLHNEDGVSQTLPFLIGELPEVVEQEPNDAPSDAQKLSDFAAPPRDAEMTVNGVLQKQDDVDSFAVQLNKGQTLVAAVAANTAFGSPIDAILQVVSPTGAVLTENHDDNGLDPRLAYAAPSDGTYIVRLFAFPATPNQTIRFHGGSEDVYRLTLTTGPYITHTIPLSVTASDAGLFPTTVEALGWNIPVGTRLPVSILCQDPRDQYIELDAAARSLDRSSKIGLVRAPSWSGSARVRITSIPVVETLAATARHQPMELSVPVSLTGRIATHRAEDEYQVQFAKGQHVRFTLDTLSIHSPLAPQIRLFTPDGKIAAEATSSGAAADVVLTHKSKQEGAYRLNVRDRFRHGGPRYFYRLTATTPTADFKLSLDTDHVVVTAGEATELSVNIERDSGEGDGVGEIEISAQELPPGVTATPVVSKNEGDSSKKVLLQFTTTNVEAFAGLIQIQGIARDMEQVRYAMTPTKFHTNFDSIWLTVKPKQALEESSSRDSTTCP